MLSINETHNISVAINGDYVLSRKVWRMAEGKRTRVSEVIAIYKSEVLLTRNLIGDCVGIADYRKEISDLNQLSDIYVRLLISCKEVFSVLSPLREKRITEFKIRLRQEEMRSKVSKGGAV